MFGVRQGRSMFLGLLLAAMPGPLWGADTSPTPSLSPEDQAAEAYRRGLRYRDEALSYEERSVDLADEAGERLRDKARKELEKAMRAFRSAVEFDPSMVAAHTELGFALRKLGDYPGSLGAYQRALELSPAYPLAVEYRAEALLGMDRLDEVKSAYLELFRSERALADQLMGAMRRWIEERRNAPGDLGAAAVEQFAQWVAEREALASQVGDLATSAPATAGW